MEVQRQFNVLFSVSSATIIMSEDNRNPFSSENTSEQKADFRVNEFSSEQASFPKFGKDSAPSDVQGRIEAAKSNGWGAQIAGFARSNKKSMLIIAAIVILFAGGSYLQNRNSPGSTPPGETAAGTNSAVLPGADLSGDTSSRVSADNASNVLDIKVDENGQVIFGDENNAAGLSDGSLITETASAGEGITHLARRAVAQYIQESGIELNAEQRVYAEDYAQNAIGGEFLEIGQKLSFSNSLLAQAVQKSQELESWQIENLKQYSAKVSLL